MPYLGFEGLPQASNSSYTGYKRGVAPSEAGISCKVSPWKPELLRDKSTTEDGLEETFVTNYPVVKLDADKITDATAARLAVSLLGHVLFLKSQVPFPVMQLGRIPGGKANTRAAKQRADLLASFDTISSHLDTTFSALLTALARCSNYNNSKLAQVYLAILVGPSIGSAKSKIILGLDGLEPSIWGNREDVLAMPEQTNEESEEGEGVDEDVDDVDEESDESSDENGEAPEDSDEEDDESEDVESEDGDDADEVPSSSPPLHISYADQQKFLQTADRLLSRTLAAADADGNGIASEMSPTQTHVLIRAPRRFNHPAWVPRQNVTISLESSLQDFMDNSGLGSSDVEFDSRIKRAKKNKLEGVWITTRAGLHQGSLRDINPATSLEGRNPAEEDDMIWWSWDGKFVGFSEW